MVRVHAVARCLLGLACLGADMGGIGVRAQTLAPAVNTSALDFYLDVWVNGVATQILAHVRQSAAGAWMMAPDTLRAVGLVARVEAQEPDGWIALNRLPGVQSRYDEAAQILYLSAPDAAMLTRVIDVQALERGEVDKALKASFAAPNAAGQDPAAGQESAATAQTFGAFVNHTLYYSTGGAGPSGLRRYQNASGLLEANLYGRLGTFTTSELVTARRGARAVGERSVRAVRLDTQWNWFDEERLSTLTAGDFVGASLAWSRAVRLGGVQWRRNFAIRPDLITMPLLSNLSGSAAVPSTVELYVNDVQRLSQNVPPGPFAIDNLPLMTGAGTARLVVRDILGRETISETPFYAASDLLAQGLSDFSVEAGFARQRYGERSLGYDKHLVTSLTARYGASNAVTLEGHTQLGAGLRLAGAGVVARLGHWGLATLSGAHSRYQSERGSQFSVSLESESRWLSFHARHQRTSGAYNDLASISLEPQAATLAPTEKALVRRNARAPRRMSQVSLSFPLLSRANVSLAYTPMQLTDGSRSRLASASLGFALARDGYVSVSAFRDLQRARSGAAFVMLSWFFDGRINASASLSKSRGSPGQTTLELARSEDSAYGSVGWRVRSAQGTQSEQARSQGASASYRSRIGRVELGVERMDARGGARPSYNGRVQIDGALVAAGGGVFLANRIDNAFGVVNVGAPDVDVLFENQPVGASNSAGQLLLTGLRPYERNQIAIDPMSLPVDARIPVLRQIARPRWKSGVTVDFGVALQTRSALVTLRDEAGNLLPVGADARLDDGAPLVVGYDGQLWLEHVNEHNRLRVRLPDADGKAVHCETMFNAPATQTGRLVLADAVCRSVP